MRVGFISIPEHEFEYSVARSSGPGGQNVNKVNSKVVLRWNVVGSAHFPEAVRQRFLARFATKITVAGEVVISSEEFRDQPKNRNACLEKLSQMILEVLTPPKRRRPSRPTRSSVAVRKESKRKLGEKKSKRGKVKSWD